MSQKVRPGELTPVHRIWYCSRYSRYLDDGFREPDGFVK